MRAWTLRCGPCKGSGGDGFWAWCSHCSGTGGLVIEGPSPEEARRIVRDVRPESGAIKCGVGGGVSVWAIFPGDNAVMPIGVGLTEDEAWDDAARRIVGEAELAGIRLWPKAEV